jgi:hypothetical protein
MLIVLLILETFRQPTSLRCQRKYCLTSRSPFRLLHHSGLGTSQCITARGSAIHCLFRHSGIIIFKKHNYLPSAGTRDCRANCIYNLIMFLGKQKMGAWTSTFTISFTLAYAPSPYTSPFYS